MRYDFPIDEALVLRLPLPLAQLYRRAHNAKTAMERHQAAYYLWEAALKLMASVAVVTYAEQPEPDPSLGDALQSLARPAVAHWWQFVRRLVPVLAAGGDPGFQGLRELLLGRPRDDFPRAAGLDAALREALDGRAGARSTVRLAELFDRLVTYRNREIGHGAVGQRSVEFYERMGAALLAGMAELLGRLDVLAGRRLLFVGDIHQTDSGRWLVERYELQGEAPRRLAPLELPAAGAAGLRPNRLYLDGSGAPGQEAEPSGMRALHPLVTYDFEAGEVFFLNARKGRQRTEYLSYTTGRLAERADLAGEQRVLLARALGVSADEVPADEWAARARDEQEAAEGIVEAAPAGPRRVGEFELLSELGRGGMGVVYRAWQPTLGRQVALKQLFRVGDPKAEARFAREIRALGRVDHPNLVKVFTSGADGEQWFYAMELIEGATLGAVCDSLQGREGGPGAADSAAWLEAVSDAADRARRHEKALDPSAAIGGRLTAPPPPPPAGGRNYSWRAVDLVRQAAEAAHALHEAGVVHRDVRPGNILVTADGTQAVLIDLGIAQLAGETEGRLTRTRQFVGTLRYASPEQVLSAALVDRRSDVYSFGATLWEVLSLRPLYGATEQTSTPELMERIQREDPESLRKYNPGVARDLEAVVFRCLEKDPRRRYATARELADDLRRYLDGEPVTARPMSGLERGWKWVKRRPATVALLGSCGLLLLAFAAGGTGAAYGFRTRELEEAAKANEAAARASQAEAESIRGQLDAARSRTEALEQENRDLAKGEIGEPLRRLQADVQSQQDHIRQLEEENRSYQAREAERDARPAEPPRAAGGGWLGWVISGLAGAALAGALTAAGLRRLARREGSPAQQPVIWKWLRKRSRPVPLDPGQAFSSQTVVLHYPAPIAIAYRRFCSRKEPRERLAQLYDTFEAVIEYLVCLGLSDLCAGLAGSGKAGAALPNHQGFDLTRRPTKMTVGQWVRTLQDTCAALAKQKGLFVPELPQVCGPKSQLYQMIFPWIIDHRNLAAHTKGNIALQSSESEALLREDRPRLEQLLQAIQFVRHYPLGFVKAGYSISEDSPLKRYRVYSCMGARVASGEEVYSMDTSAGLQPGVPFVAAPDGSALHYLWPFLMQRESDKTQHPSLYVFEGIEEGSRFLAHVSSAAIDHADAWEQELCPKVAKGENHDWLWDELRRLPAVVTIDPALRLAEGLAHSLVGILSGEALGKNRLHGPIARGGFGTIYDAEDADGRRVAVKVLEAREGLDSEDDRKQFERFQQEYRRLKSAGQRHRGIVECYEWGCDILGRREYPWYSMEFAPGGDLNGRLRERRAQLPKGRVAWDDPALRRRLSEEFRAIAGAVAFLHEQHIVHRDVKPANVLIMDGGELRLSDFGLVKAVGGAAGQFTQHTAGPGSTQGALLGTLAYMAPEQARGETVGKPADVYSLGIVLAELATGHWPCPDARISAGSPIDTEDNRGRLDRLPPPLRRLILACTDREPSNRPHNAREVLVEFEHIRAALDPKPPEDDPRPRAPQE